MATTRTHEHDPRYCQECSQRYGTTYRGGTMPQPYKNYVPASDVRGLIDRIPAGRLDHEAIAELDNISQYARDVATRVATELYERRIRAREANADARNR